MRKNTTSLSDNTFELPDHTDIKQRAKTEEKEALYRVLNTLPNEEIKKLFV